jgi:CBS domain-containing protein
MEMIVKMAARREAFRRRLREQGPLSLKTHPAKKREGEIMSIAKSPVVTMAPTTPIYDAVRIMSKEGFRRVPVVDPGSKRLLGMITATDIVNFFGGGEKHQLIQRKYGGNFYKAINEPIRSIMTQDVTSIHMSGKISEALDLMKRHKIGGLPVVDDDKRVWAILTEKDLISLFGGRISGVKVAELMTRRVVTATPNMSIFEAERTMIEQGFRRLPIVSDKKVLGMVTARSILRFFGSGQVFKHLQSGTIAQVLQTSVLEASIKGIEERIVSPSIDVGEAARIMEEKDVGSLLVVENERLVGIITERDFFKLIP